MAQVNIRIDDNLKEKAEKLFDELGLNMTTAFNIFIRQTVREGGIPFTITTYIDPFYSDNNMTMLRKSIKEVEEGKIVTKTMEELMAMEK
jgi:DNA-damage-inducible protein J